jgi:hypothetical protein
VPAIAPRFVLILVLICACLCVTRSAHAAMMQHTDLTSLVLDSDEIVLARRAGERDGGPWSVINDHVVTKVYAGTLAPNDVVSLDYGAYSMTPLWGWGQREGGAPKMSDAVVLFLVRPTKENGYNAAPGGFWLAHSGLRILYDDTVYRFEQWNNPGPYEPVPQGHDPYDVLGDPRGSTPLTLPQFEADLARAIARANDIRDALAQATTPSGQTRLLELLGPASDDDALFPLTLHTFYSDDAARRILDAIAQQHDLPLFLAAVARTRGRTSLYRVRHSFTLADIAREARSAARTTPERLAAISLIATRHSDEVDDATVIALMSDGDVEIRRAATTLFGRSVRAGSARARALAERWQKEPDEGVRYALFVAARDSELLGTLAVRDRTAPVFSGVRKGRGLVLAWGKLDNEPSSLTRLVVSATSGGVSRTKAYADSERNGWSTMNAWGATVLLEMDPPLAPGTYDIAVDVELTNPKNAKSPNTTRHLTLGQMRVSEPSASTSPPASASPSASPSASGSAPASVSASASASASPPPSRPPGACGCRVIDDVGREKSSIPALVVALATCASAAFRRRRSDAFAGEK